MANPTLVKSLKKAVKKIAPLWPLESFVAVNPYLGLSHLPFHEAAQRLHKVGAGRMTLPMSFYQEALSSGTLRHADVQQALQALYPHQDRSADALLADVWAVEEEDGMPEVSSFTDVATDSTGKDWNQWTQELVSAWAAVYFDKGQVAWNTTPRSLGLYQAWREEAMVNRTPDISGLTHYRTMIKGLPADPYEAAQEALKMLGLPTVGIDLYLHRLLARVQGWAAYAGYLDWQKGLYENGEGLAQVEFLVVLLCIEAALYKSMLYTSAPIQWEQARRSLLHLAVEESTNSTVANHMVLQYAYDLAAQRKLVAKFGDKMGVEIKAQPRAQAVFCIDVRSEVYRRQLENAAPDIETLGFAGFFAFPIQYKPLGHEAGRAQCPVLLPAGPTVAESLADPRAREQAVQHRQDSRQLAQAWKAFKKGAVSCFAYVSPMGLSFLPKLITDALSITRPVAPPSQEGLSKKQHQHITLELEGENGLPLDKQIELATGALRAMSLTENFGRLVLIVGHGANTVNNPHASGLDCGACGGNAGEANARVAATVLNRPQVRQALAAQGIHIPDTTWFLGCLHDTTTDEVTIYERKGVPATHQSDLMEIEENLRAATQEARAERAPRLGIQGNSVEIDAAVMARSKDWAQVRPEWGLAGCSAFVVAPRQRTLGVDLQGRSFLHSYQWQQDEGFKVLELIMTAPMIVTSWINLQYYASTVDNHHYGAGNKTLHNVTSGLGVLEGSTGDLRTGLAWQSVHDGEQYQHLPVRLNVIIEAPIEAMNGILDKHANVRQLLDNQWIYLWAMNDQGRVSHRYQGHGQWQDASL